MAFRPVQKLHLFVEFWLSELFFPSSNHLERKKQHVQKDSHQQCHSPNAGVCEGVDEPIADVVQQLERHRRGRNITTLDNAQGTKARNRFQFRKRNTLVSV